MKTDLHAALSSTLRSIKRQCDAYDNGIKEAAGDIAVKLRLLFYDTQNSRSLLTLLDVKRKVSILSAIGGGRTVAEERERRSLGQAMISMNIEVSIEGVKPMLYRPGDKLILLPVKTWLEEIAYSGDTLLDRITIIERCSHVLGGAHVDPDIPSDIAEVIRGIGKFTSHRGTENLADHQYMLLRQLGDEVLNTPDLAKLAKGKIP